MPLKTAVPSVRRIFGPGIPVAINRGNTPRMKANDVMIIGRSRNRQARRERRVADGHARSPLLLGEFDDKNRCSLLASHDKHHEPDLGENIDVHWNIRSRQRIRQRMADRSGNAFRREAPGAARKEIGTAVTPMTAAKEAHGHDKDHRQGKRPAFAARAASTRKTIITAKPKMLIAVLPGLLFKKGQFGPFERHVFR